MDIKAFKLNSGEEVVAEVIERVKAGVKIKNPVILREMTGQDGKPVVEMVGWFQLSGGDSKGNEQTNRLFTWKNDHVFCEEPPLEKVKEIYEQQFGTGLVTPKQKIITAV